MTPYWVVFSTRFRALIQYRAAALAGLGTQVFWGLIKVAIFAAFYGAATGPQPMTYPEVVTYIWLGQAFLLIVMYGVDADVEVMIRTGTVAYELVRPVDLYGVWYARAVAMRTGPVLLRAVPMFVVAGLFFGMQPPASVVSGALWAASTAAAVLLSAALNTAMTVTLFWTLSGEGVSRLMPAAAWVFSGMIVPVPLWPDRLKPLFYALPFRGMADTPFRLYLGHIAPSDALGAIAHQVLWTAALVALGRVLLRRGARRLVVQGG